MEDLTGGSLSLEQRYDIEYFDGHHAGSDVYRGTQFPIERPVWIHVLPHPDTDVDVRRYWIEKIRGAVLRSIRFESRFFYEIVDFGEVEDAPFVVYQRDSFHRLSEILNHEGTLELEATQLIIQGLAEACIDLEERGFSHGGIHPGVVFLSDDGDVKLIEAGVGFSPPEIIDYELKGKALMYGVDSRGEYSDAFAIACLAYELLSGVHPFLDVDGDLIMEEPSHPAEFGVEMDFAEKIFSQFGDDTRDLRLFLDVKTSVEEPQSVTQKMDTPVSVERGVEKVIPREPDVPKLSSGEEDFEEEMRTKSNLGVGFTIAIIAILLAALVYQTLNPMTQLASGSAREESTKLKLRTDPEGAEVRLDGQRIGITPFVIDATMMENMALEIEKEGFKSSKLELTHENNKTAIRVPLEKL